ncbi:hypothetical protein QQF64_004751 [Cirrhinus molitorella]|uniref:Uncharacterized protein n=1 Tax=Cirrhinus molitorella TaxID=172907 RepID=A0ABR3MH45_9TELE
MCGNTGGAQKAGGSNCCHFTQREPVKLNRSCRRRKAWFTDDPECDRKKKACCDVLINTYLKSHYACRCTSDASLM